jgi:acyl-CoA thioester hydrolase
MTPLTMPITVRQQEIDGLGHVNHTVYFQWADHARTEFLRRAGIDLDTLLATNKVAPIVLEARALYLRELRLDDKAEVSCEPSYGPMTITVFLRVTRDDGSLAAEITQVIGLRDQDTMQLIPDPLQRLRSLAARPNLLELRD